MLRNILGCYSKSTQLITMTILVAKLQYFIKNGAQRNRLPSLKSVTTPINRLL